MRYRFYIFIIYFTLLYMESFAKDSKELSIIMGGDALLHTAIYKDAEFICDKKDKVNKINFIQYSYNLSENDIKMTESIESKKSKSAQICYEFSQMFEPLKDSIKKYDLAFYNQESILGGSMLGLSSYPNFNSPQEFGDAMVNLGFNLISLANNHTLDKGQKAILESIKFWQEKEKKGVIIAGSYDSTEARNASKIYKKNGITFAFLAYTYGTNGIKIPQNKEYLVNVYSIERLKQDINSLKNKVDLIIVSMHWGIEYKFVPSKEQRDLAQMLSDLGVHIVIGTHPHVLQPVEFVGDTLVIYSLGNMLSAQRGVEKKVGALVALNVTKKDGKVVLSDVKADLIYTYHNEKLQDFKVYPFSFLNENILPNYEQIYKDYVKILLDSKEDSKKQIKIGIF